MQFNIAKDISSVNGSGGRPVGKTLLTASTEGTTVVKTLEIIGAGVPAKVHVIRNDGSADYADIPLDVMANDYLLLWEGFFVLPANHVLKFHADQPGVAAVVHYVVM